MTNDTDTDTDAVQANQQPQTTSGEIEHTCNPVDRLFHLMSLAGKSEAEILRSTPRCSCNRRI